VKKVKNKKIIPSFLFFILLTNFILLVGAQPVLNITVTTDKPSYDYRDQVQIFGELSSDGITVTDALVAILVVAPGNDITTMRTVNTGTDPSGHVVVEVRQVYPCDLGGTYRSTFQKTSLAYFNVTLSNYDVNPRHVFSCINLYDNQNSVIADAAVDKTLQGRESTWDIIPLEIPYWANSGEAVAYVNAYSDLPTEGGVPYCPEVAINFNIEASYPAYVPPAGGSSGTYDLTFILPHSDEVGSYDVYVSASYDGETVFNDTIFVYQIQGDFDGDGDIDYLDIISFVDTYIAYNLLGEPLDPAADLNNDEDINYQDIILFVDAYIAYGS
jgi:hypothetical protein